MLSQSWPIFQFCKKISEKISQKKSMKFFLQFFFYVLSSKVHDVMVCEVSSQMDKLGKDGNTICTTKN